jgi:hypothetical protein
MTGKFTADNQPKKRGRPKGSPNKVPREMKDAIVAAMEELGRIPRKDWEKHLAEGGNSDDLTGFFKVLAVHKQALFGRLFVLPLIPRERPPRRASTRVWTGQ